MYIGPTIIKDNLILCLDAANPKSYPGTGLTWSDLSIYNNTNNGLLTGPTFNNINNGALLFDGNDRVSLNNIIKTGNDFTVAAWVYITSFSIRNAIVGNSYNYSGKNGWLFTVSSGSPNPIGSFFLSIGNDNIYLTSSSLLSLNKWVYLSATCENGGNIIKLYKDGLRVGVKTTPYNGDITYTYNQSNIGLRDISGAQDPFLGNISQVTVYNKVLTDIEILQNFNALRNRLFI
jgi:hypothetical protein